jgi:hypothetical protein
MLQGVMSQQQRREIGAHYTSEENILKVINPLFMDELWDEFERIKLIPKALDNFHDKISRLRFLDPACGCGNFLIITYRELRRLELEILKLQFKKSSLFDIERWLKVKLGQFYGIEIEDFPCQIFQVGMWLMEHQMNLRVSEIIKQLYVRLPLGKSANVVHGNALRIDWGTVVPKGELSYILGNPPFNGARTMLSRQKDDMGVVFGDLKGLGNLDYVTAWYKKAADMMKGTNIRSAFVSTNSIVQGEQPGILWKELMRMGIHINFGVPTFKWSNDASGKATVHCVIVGFSYLKTEPIINQYLVKAPIVFIESRQKPICCVPDMVFGNMPNDGGNLILSAEEYKEFIKYEPRAKKYIRRFMGADEFINNIPRYCLWLNGVEPSELRKMPFVMSRLEGVRNHRMASKREGTRKLADVPMLFGEIRQPDKDYIIVPRVSSEKRRYIPIGFVSPDVIANDSVLMIPDACLYHFGVLTSRVHMELVRAVCCRLEMRYSYSKYVFYNNFTWPNVTGVQRGEIAKLAQSVLNVRGCYSASSLADLYDNLSVTPEFHKAHQNLDRAVMKLYGFKGRNTPGDEECVVMLMDMYKKLVE